LLTPLNHAAWTANLRRIATEPLEFCPDFPAIARRYEAWWACACTDRPIFIGTTNAQPARPIARRLELLNHPDEWFAAKLADLHQQSRSGDALPNIRVDFGPVLLGGLLGGTIEFGSDTTWTHAFINDDWSNAPDWQLRDNQSLFQRLRQLTELVAQDSPGRYLVCTPDLGGSADVLLNLRGSSALCLDVVEQPDRVRNAIDAMYPAWEQTFTELYRIATAHKAGLIHWLGLWSSRPYLIPACDFNFLIGPSEFAAICLPDIVRQAATAGRAVFHLDGPGAARHIDALLAVPELQAIQFSPGAGTPSALAWVEMFRKIQAAGRALYVYCPADEALALAAALRPEGLAIVCNTDTPKELDDLFDQFARRYTAGPPGNLSLNQRDFHETTT